jgi:hypothetical protein
MESIKRKGGVKILTLLLVIFFLFPSCSTKKPGSFRRIKGKKVWVPKRSHRLERRYERCYF